VQFVSNGCRDHNCKPGALCQRRSKTGSVSVRNFFFFVGSALAKFGKCCINHLGKIGHAPERLADASSHRRGQALDTSANSADFKFVHLVQHGERVFVTYEGRNTSGKAFRNTEILTVKHGKLVDVEVYFGWTLPHAAAAGGFTNEGEQA
jgi:hypothetical protein